MEDLLITRTVTRFGLRLVKYDSEIPWTDPMRVNVVPEFGKEANASCAKLEIEEISGEYANIFKIHEYHGFECVECN